MSRAEEPDAGRRSGRRGNGLAAGAYVPLAEFDPRLADAVLQALGEAGIAAYVTPFSGTTGGYLEVSLPDRPTDRVWVDSAARPRAEAVLAQLSNPPVTEPAPGDEEESWRAIVATFSAEPTGTPSWPPDEELPSEGSVAGRLVRPAGRADRYREPAEGTGTAEAAEVTDPADDEHYVPPVPPPVPAPHPVTRWAVLALIGGVAVLVLPAIFAEPVGPGLALLAVLAVLGGFATLVARMRDAPPTDSGPDDGAVV